MIVTSTWRELTWWLRDASRDGAEILVTAGKSEARSRKVGAAKAGTAKVGATRQQLNP
jgi:hypothetical protein